MGGANLKEFSLKSSKRAPNPQIQFLTSINRPRLVPVWKYEVIKSLKYGYISDSRESSTENNLYKYVIINHVTLT